MCIITIWLEITIACCTISTVHVSIESACRLDDQIRRLLLNCRMVLLLLLARSIACDKGRLDLWRRLIRVKFVRCVIVKRHIRLALLLAHWWMLGRLRSILLELLLRSSVLIIIHGEEDAFTVRMTDRIRLLPAFLFSLLGRSWSGRWIDTRLLLVEISATIAILERVLAHLGCNFLLFSPGYTGSCSVAAISWSADASVPILIDSGRSCHSVALWCLTADLTRVG